MSQNDLILSMKKIILNMNELKKYKVIKLVSEDRKSKKRATVELNLTIRHINRLLNAYHKEGKKHLAIEIEINR